MKTKPISFAKVRPLNTTDIYYTSPSWEHKEVDGVKFVYVVRNFSKMEFPKLMRKDSLEYIK